MPQLAAARLTLGADKRLFETSCGTNVEVLAGNSLLCKIHTVTGCILVLCHVLANRDPMRAPHLTNLAYLTNGAKSALQVAANTTRTITHELKKAVSMITLYQDNGDAC